MKIKYKGFIIEKDLWGVGYYVLEKNGWCVKYTFTSFGAKRVINKYYKKMKRYLK